MIHRRTLIHVRSIMALSILAPLTIASAQELPVPKVPGGKLSFALPDLEGKIVSSDDKRFKGKVVIVDIMGTWCGPCRKLSPYLGKLYDEHHAEGLEIVAICFESEDEEAARRKTIQEYANEHQLKYTFLDGGKLGAESEVEAKLKGLEGFGGYPTTIFIDREGKVLHLELGFSDGGAPELIERVEKMLAEKPGTVEIGATSESGT